MSPGDLHAITRLAKRAEVDLTLLDRNADDFVRGAVDRYLERLIISLDQRAVEDLLLAALEAYAVPRPGPGQRYTEAYGYCFGTLRTMPREGRERRYTQAVNISRVITQLRVRSTASEFWPNDRSEAVHRAVAAQFFRHLVLVGDYHTHPYNNYATLRKSPAGSTATPTRSFFGLGLGGKKERRRSEVQPDRGHRRRCENGPFRT